MNDRAFPEELFGIIRQALPRDVVPRRSGWSQERLAWWFELLWARRSFELDVAEKVWLENRRELIQLRAALAAPRPEATLGGRQFHIALESTAELPDAVRFVFARYDSVAEPPRLLRIGISRRQIDCGHDPEACRIVAALACLKDRLDDGSESSEAVVMGCPGGTAKRSPVPARKVHHYVELKLQQAYRIARKVQKVGFGWPDFAYLGLDEETFLSILREREQKDWYIEGAWVSPTIDLWFTWQFRGAFRAIPAS